MTRENATHTELAIVGAGTAGYAAGIRAGQLGLDVTLIEAGEFGGTCLNAGCIPSKALINAADVAHDAANAEAMGVYADPEVNFAEMVEWKDGIVDTLTGAVEKLNKANGVSVIEGTATFEDEHSLAVELADGETESYEFDNALVATGSRPIEVPGFEFDGEYILSSRDALALDAVPDELVVVGAGYIGMELSMVFAKLGADVTVVEMLDEMLPGYDRDLISPVEDEATALGIDFAFGEAASDWSEDGDGLVLETETEDGEVSTYEADKAIVAVGREPVTDSANLEALGLDPERFIETDDQCRTAVEHVFAAGDVAGEPLLAHAGTAEGLVAAETIAGEDASMADRAIPAAVFTEPEIAMVGHSVAEAEDAGYDTQVGEFPFRSSGRALTTGHQDGFVRIVADAENGRVLGARIVGPEASELIAELGLAVRTGATIEDVASTIHTHPTLAESTMEAAENALGQAIHTLNR
ncbi:dihydrolipoamide dehydrogenase [Halodesulfurarchaeum formicicum]|uniref:Dihydrolipoyl dehydrogenase n=1 Tax=Halodesulfurarchaeum formicicum TaxID=1873524 RepID=A0A1D8S211_9EURY|nr:dihydrolipoyl dehydrogenase [Halodesulfurarchaeum formicicum]AOW79389.1 dihydrolipoamide dehydrogenase [Halodesulfurarchaeum formicicum]